MKNIKYLAKFRQGHGAMAMNAIDYYLDNGVIIKHIWSMGGETKTPVDYVPKKIDNFERIN